MHRKDRNNSLDRADHIRGAGRLNAKCRVMHGKTGPAASCIAGTHRAQRAAIHLGFFEELSYAEIAGIEKVPVGMVKTRIFHAKKLLQHWLSR